MKFVPFHELDIECVGERRADESFARTGDSHHHEKAIFHRRLIRQPARIRETSGFLRPLLEQAYDLLTAAPLLGAVSA
ncbi:MAG TPA: hypothetical protein VJ032_01105, partial [Thermoanaerobaculia bacterium]|nr:hypothetical protein [Thermoanaerobaculia bacterium]